MNRYAGPQLKLSQEIDIMKYRQEGEDFHDKVERLADALCDTEEHNDRLLDIFGDMRFLAAGRVQSAMGSKRITTAYNCMVSGTIDDSMASIMEKATEAAETMRRGAGIGYDFSTIRPRGNKILSLDSQASGPVSFMSIFDSVCQTIASSGHRRGAQMGALRVDHPDIKEFVTAKRNSDRLTGFNVSVAVTDKFMEALDKEDDSFNLVFEGIVYDTISAKDLWEQIMLSTWDWAEPGVLFIDRINEMNNLYYCEEIAATNPCGEQPLPPYGACLLGSFNLTKYLYKVHAGDEVHTFNFKQFKDDIPHVVRAMDNVVDRTIYPLTQQATEAKNKRRMGLGITGLANAGEMLGLPYGSDSFLNWAEKVFSCLRDKTYMASAQLAEEKGAFPAYRQEYIKSNFIKTLPHSVRKEIKKHGIRNSHLTSFAPTGTISLVADNISSGIEPTFSKEYDRTIQTFEGPRVDRVQDYAFARGVSIRTADELQVCDHLNVLALASHYVDSAVSKTINVGETVSYDEFKNIYSNAWKEGVKGITTFRAAGKRYGILNAATVEAEEESESKTEEVSTSFREEAVACFMDPTTGQKECA